MKLNQKMVLGVVMMSLCFAAGCKKKDAADTGVVAQAVSEENWVVEDVNGLLPYVPENSPLVIASTRELDMSNPALKMVIDSISTSVMSSVTKVENEVASLKQTNKAAKAAEAEKVMRIYHIIQPLFQDFAQGAVTWGLDPLAHIDLIAYFDEGNPVIKFSLKDSAKFEGRMLELLDAVRNALPAKSAMPEMIERKVGDETFRVQSIKPYIDNTHGVCVLCVQKKSYMPSNLVIHVGKKSVTLALLGENIDDAALKRMVSPAASPLKKEAFGKIDSDMMLVGYTNTHSAYHTIMTQYASFMKSFVSTMYKTELTPVCETEIKSLISKFPKISFESRVSKENGFSSTAVLQMADKTWVKKLQDLHAPVSQIQTDKSQFGAALNFNLDATLELLKNIRSGMQESKYECELLQQIPDAIKDVTDIVSDPQIKMFTSGLTGVNIAIDKLDVQTKPMNVEAAIALSGTKFGLTIPSAMLLLSAVVPNHKEMFALQKDSVKEIDLTSMVNQPLKINMIYNDTSFIAGTTGYDVKTLAAKPQVKNNQYIDIMLNTSSDKAREIIDMITLPQSIQTMSLGTNAEGLTYTIQFKPVQ